MSKNNTNSEIYFVTGGGTGGHIYPALAIIKELKNKYQKKVYYIGNPNNPEKELAKENHIDFLPVNINGMPRKISFQSIIWSIKLIYSILVGMVYIKKYRPKIVFGTGGYVSAPILFASKLLNVPYMLHDADAQPGVVTRCLAPYAKLLTTPFESVKDIFPDTNIEITGNPIRYDFVTISKVEAKEQSDFSQKRILLIMGGSQGAKAINNAIVPILKQLIDEFDIGIIHQTGKRNFGEVEELLNKYFPDYEKSNNYKVMPYIDNMPTILKSCDIAISRSGSLSLSEMKASGVASILIPYPYSASGHQKFNAEEMVKLGCSLMIENQNLSSEILYDTIKDVLSTPDKLQTMQEIALKNAQFNATQIITERLVNYKNDSL